MDAESVVGESRAREATDACGSPAWELRQRRRLLSCRAGGRPDATAVTQVSVEPDQARSDQCETSRWSD